MDTCANCNAPFKARDKGYHRFNLEKVIPATGNTARSHLEQMFSIPITPVSKKTEAKFLCSVCWSDLSNAAKYKKAMTEIWASTESTSYVGSKRLLMDIASPGTSKRPRYTSTPLKTKSKAARPIFGKSKSGKWDTIINAIRSRHYRRAFSNLYNATAGTKRQFNEFLLRIVRKEMSSLLNSREFPLSKDVSIQNISDFSWEQTLNMATEKAPILLNVLKGAVTTKSNHESMMRNAKVSLKPRIGTALAVLMNAKAPSKAKFLPSLLSVQFWRGRLKRETIKQLSRLGLCAGYEATLSTIDRLRAKFDEAALKLKENMEAALPKRLTPPVEEDEGQELSLSLSVSAPNVEDEVTYYSDMEETILYSDLSSTNLSDTICKKDEEDADECEDGENDTESEEDNECEEEDNENESEDEGECKQEESDDEGEMDIVMESTFDDEPGKPLHTFSDPPGFTMCWDNVGKKDVTRHPTETVKNRYLNMALGYIAINRVPSIHMKWENDNTVSKAVYIPLERFLPNLSDINQLRSRMHVIVGRILTRHLEWFRLNFSDLSVPHILHANSLRSSYKSVLINLGVFNENPSSTQGAIGIYEELQKYVPSVDGKPYTTIVYGDGLSCERGNDAHRARSNGLSPSERLEGLEPAVQEFHKEMILLQDFYDVFFKGGSASDRGTLCQIRNIFNFRQVKSDVLDNFSYAWELMCLVVEGFVCLMMMCIGEMKERNARPSNAPENIEYGTDEARSSYFHETVQRIVDGVWQPLDFERLKTDDHSGVLVICCGEDLDEDLIGCECRSSCSRGEFFHYSCAGIDPENIPVPWYCSDECKYRNVEPYKFCECQTDLGSDEPMIGCSAESQCTRFEWYHMRCLAIDPIKAPKGKWFFCDPCKMIPTRKQGKTSSAKSDPQHDYVFNYSSGIVWQGLNLLCRRDAVREADGEAILSFWKFDLIHFFGYKHPKYVILAHRLLASVNGWLPSKLRHDLIHNRTVNYGGGMGRNLPLDFMDEILNRLFKDLLESSKGRYTDTTIHRCSLIIGPLGDALDNVFDTSVVENELYRHRRRAQNRDSNVSRLIELLGNQNLFSIIRGRKHSAFPNFVLSETPRQAGKFPAKMKQLSKVLDKRRRIVINS